MVGSDSGIAENAGAGIAGAAVDETKAEYEVDPIFDAVDLIVAVAVRGHAHLGGDRGSASITFYANANTNSPEHKKSPIEPRCR